MTDENLDAEGESQDNIIVKYFKDFRVLRETKKEYWGLQIVNALDCLAYFAMFNIATVTLSKDFGFTDVGAGLIYTAFSTVTTMFLFISGVITDWLGIKKALYLALLGLLLGRAGVVAVQYMDEPVRMNVETPVAVLYDGTGLPFVEGQPDLAITAGDGTAFVVDLSGSATIGDVLEKINGATGNGGRIEASIAPGWTSLRLQDHSEGPDLDDLTSAERMELLAPAFDRLPRKQLVKLLPEKLRPAPPPEGEEPPEEPEKFTADEITALGLALAAEENVDAVEEIILAARVITVGPTEANPDAAKKLELVTDPEKPPSGTFNGMRIISDLNGLDVAEFNQGEGLSGGTTLEVTDRLGQKMTVTGLDQLATANEILTLFQKEAEAQPANVKFSLNTPGNGFRISDQNKAPDGSKLQEGDLIVAGTAAEALHLWTEADDEAGELVAGSALVENKLRSMLTWVLLVFMAPFMAMLQTCFQAGNRRFTTKKSRGAGFNLWYLFMNVGAAGGGFLIDIIYLKSGLPHFHVFTFGVGTGVLCLLVTFLTIKNTDQLRSPDEVVDEEEEEKKKEKKDSMGPLEITKAVLIEPIFWRFTVLITLLLGVRAVFLYLGLLFPKFWYRVIGEDAQVGLMQAWNPLGVIVGLIVLIPILQKFNVYKMLTFGALITSISMFVPAIPPMLGIGIVEWTYWMTGIFLFILTIGELIWSPRLSEYTAAIAPEGQEGTYLGLSMVPYFMAKLVVSAFSGAMLMRWCPEYPPGEPNVGERIAAGDLGFWDTPYVMWLILGAVALIGTLAAIAGKSWFTKGAHFDKN